MTTTTRPAFSLAAALERAGDSTGAAVAERLEARTHERRRRPSLAPELATILETGQLEESTRRLLESALRWEHLLDARAELERARRLRLDAIANASPHASGQRTEARRLASELEAIAAGLQQLEEELEQHPNRTGAAIG